MSKSKFKSRLQTRGAKNGICNICGADGPLTEDHIPPKGVSRLQRADMISFLTLFGGPHPSKTSRFTQDGMKYRTLCAGATIRSLVLNTTPP